MLNNPTSPKKVSFSTPSTAAAAVETTTDPMTIVVTPVAGDGSGAAPPPLKSGGGGDDDEDEFGYPVEGSFATKSEFMTPSKFEPVTHHVIEFDSSPSEVIAARATSSNTEGAAFSDPRIQSEERSLKVSETSSAMKAGTALVGSPGSAAPTVSSFAGGSGGTFVKETGEVLPARNATIRSFEVAHSGSQTMISPSLRATTGTQFPPPPPSNGSLVEEDERLLLLCAGAHRPASIIPQGGSTIVHPPTGALVNTDGGATRSTTSSTSVSVGPGPTTTNTSQSCIAEDITAADVQLIRSLKALFGANDYSKLGVLVDLHAKRLLGASSSSSFLSSLGHRSSQGGSSAAEQTVGAGTTLGPNSSSNGNTSSSSSSTHSLMEKAQVLTHPADIDLEMTTPSSSKTFKHLAEHHRLVLLSFPKGPEGVSTTAVCPAQHVEVLVGAQFQPTHPLMKNTSSHSSTAAGGGGAAAAAGRKDHRSISPQSVSPIPPPQTSASLGRKK